ncbi:Transient receptor potential cation channel [Oopsacas minuta]|uniref:Transient receptor potential cation channel n=1 Tax=Oopsacas minuta TaxID=111878 RepID=A0AAV7JF21_9METZ|nr:Transient receptor potential cation channel [Oopsacas minuta]
MAQDNYSTVHDNNTELQPLTDKQSDEPSYYTSENTLSWCVDPCTPCENEKWKIPFAVGKSNYLNCHLGKTAKHTKQQVYDVLEVPIEINQESDYAKYADQIINILNQPHQHGWNQMKWNFDSSIKYMNIILYIPDVFQTLSTNNVMIPKTALPILGNTLHELITRTKAWVFSSGEFTPICNTIGEGVYKASLQENSLIKGLKKRLELTGFMSKFVENAEEPFINRENSRYLLEDKYCENLSNSLSPFSNLHILIKYGKKYDQLYEKLLYNIGVALRLPTLKMIARVNEQNHLYGFDIDFLDPYTTQEHSTPSFYDLFLVQSDLFRVILSKADDFYHRNEDLLTGWNIVTMAIFLNEPKRVERAVVKSHFAALTDEAQLERIFRYALVYGSRKVIKTIFENETLSKLLRTRSEKILELTFQKSSNEIFLYNRLMIALDIVDEHGTKKKQFNYLNLVKITIQNLISHGLVWLPPVRMFDREEVNHILAFFPEYIMVWGVMSQRYEVIELFLKYSGLHQQYLSTEDDNLSTQKGVYQICNALAISAMLRGVAKKLKHDISVTTADFDDLISNSKRFDIIATELLDHALTKDEATLRTLLNTHSPFWSNKSALDIAFIGKAYTFLNHNAVQIYLQHVWSGYDTLRQVEGERVHVRERLAQSILHPLKPSSVRFLYIVINTARTGYLLHGLFFLFLIICIIYLLTVPTTTSNYEVYNYMHIDPIEWVLLVCLFGFTVEELNQYITSVLKDIIRVGLAEWKIVLKLVSLEYFDSIWNKLDLIIIFMFIISVVVRTLSVFYIGFPINLPRLIYGVSAIPLFIRSFQHILVIKAIGPLIYTIYQASLKMMKFLIIIIILSIAVGTLQIALLTPATSISIRFRHLIFTPMYQIFGDYFFEDLQSHTYKLIGTANVTSDGIFWERTDFLIYFTVSIWILIINVLILNLMIAYFTRIYDDVATIAKSIYIWQFIEIVNEFDSRTIFPPPFNLLLYPFEFIIFLIKVKLRKSAKIHKDALFEMIDEKKLTSNKFNVYFATHYENSFADKYWEVKYVDS